MACFDLSGKELWHNDFGKSSVSALEFDATGANVTVYGMSSWQTFSAASGSIATGGSNAVPALVSGQTIPLGGYLVTSGVQSSTSSGWLSIHDRTGAKFWEATSVPTDAIPIGLASDGTLYVVSSGSLFIYETGIRAAAH